MGSSLIILIICGLRMVNGDVVEGMLMKAQPIQGVRDSLKGKGDYSDVVEGTIVKAQAITGGRGFENGKEEYLR